MGFFRDLIGDIECGIISLDMQHSEKACDKYTGGRGTREIVPMSTETSSTKVNQAISKLESLVDATTKSNNNASADAAKKIADNDINPKIVAEATFHAIFNVLKKRGYNDAIANDVANFFAGYIIGGNDISELCEVKISDIISKARSGGFSDSSILHIINVIDILGSDDTFESDIEEEMNNNPAIASLLSAHEQESTVKPFTMNLQQFVQANDKIMPAIVG